MRSWAIGMGALVAALCGGALTTPGQAVFAAGAYCPGGPARALAHKAPAELAPAVAQAFGVGPEVIGEAAYVRCAGAKLMACWVGANLDCGKADTRRRLVGASAFCGQNPGSDSVPMAATGHATIYDWRCVGRRAVAGKTITAVDAEGYIAGNWRELR
ncbi:MAG: hypothetical protein ACLQJL_02980 [Roseiarcus sp.]